MGPYSEKTFWFFTTERSKKQFDKKFTMKFVLIAFALTVLVSCSKVSGRDIKADLKDLDQREFATGAEEAINHMIARDDEYEGCWKRCHSNTECDWPHTCQSDHEGVKCCFN